MRIGGREVVGAFLGSVPAPSLILNGVSTPFGSRLDLSGWQIRTDANGLGQIAEEPTSPYYLTIADDDSASHDPVPLSPAFEFVNPSGNDFRVDKAFATQRNKKYRVTFPMSFLTSSADDRMSLAVIKGNRASFYTPTVISGATAPFGASTSIVFEFTTDNDVLGDQTYIRFNSLSPGTDTRVFFGDPVVARFEVAPVAAGALIDQTFALGQAISPVNLLADFTSDDDLVITTTDLPDGLSVNPATGILSGTPNELIVNEVITVTATDSLGQTAQSAFQIAVEVVGVITVTLSNPVATPFEPINAELAVTTDTAGTVNYSAVPRGGGTTVSGSIVADAPGTVEKVITGLDSNKVYDVTYTATDANTVSASVDLTRTKMLVWVGGRSVAEGGLDPWDNGTQFPAGTRFYNTNTGLWEYPNEGAVSKTGTGMSPWLTFAQAAAVAYPHIDLYFYNAAIFGQPLRNIQSGTDIFETGITVCNALIASDPTIKLGLITMIHGSSVMQTGPSGIEQYFSLRIPQYYSDIVTRITGSSDKTPLVWGTYVQSFVDTRLFGTEFNVALNDRPNDYLFFSVFDGSTGVTLIPEDEVHPDAAGNRLMGTRVLPAWTAALANTTRRSPVAVGAITNQTDLQATPGSISAPGATGTITSQSDVRV